MKKRTDVVLIGAGNLAYSLAAAFDKKKFNILQVYSRTLSHAKALAKKFKSAATDNIFEIDYTADLYIIAVSDDAIRSLSEKLTLPGKLVIHTSGTVDISVLTTVSNTSGVIYPLQTFSKDHPLSFENIPLCIEGSDKKTLSALKRIASQLSGSVHILNSEKRRAAHLAAVFANNFTNHLLAVAEELLLREKLSRQLIIPLVQQTAARIVKSPAKLAQTGPARRGDINTMKAHMKMLAADKDLQRIYKLLSEDIIRTYHKKD